MGYLNKRSIANHNRKGKYHFSNKAKEKFKNENNSNWKGDDVSIKSLHEWVRRHKPKPELCEECYEQSPKDLANISGKYHRDINDFRWLCRKCHMKSDERLKLLQKAHKIIDKYTDLPISAWQKWKLRHPNYKRKVKQ